MFVTNNTSRLIEITYRNNNKLLLSLAIKPYALLQEVKVAEANKKSFLQACDIWVKTGKIKVIEQHPDSVKEIETQALEASDTFDANTAEEQAQIDELYTNISNTIAEASDELAGATETTTSIDMEVVPQSTQKKKTRKSK